VPTEPGFRFILIQFFAGLTGVQAYVLVLGVLFLCGLGVPIPEDITLIAAGFLASTGNISLPGAFIAGFVGVMVGDVFLFMIGRRYGRAVFQWPGFRKVFTPARIESAEKRIQSNAAYICFFARFMPGLRSPIFLMCGILKVRFSIFFGLDFFAAVLSVPLWVYAGYWFGNNIEGALQFAHEANIVIFGALGLVLAVAIFRYYRKKRTVKQSTSSAR
jgi:membrane protein DedA with SNARE-associated domain